MINGLPFWMSFRSLSWWMTSMFEVSNILYDILFVACPVTWSGLLAKAIVDQITSKRAGRRCNLTVTLVIMVIHSNGVLGVVIVCEWLLSWSVDWVWSRVAGCMCCLQYLHLKPYTYIDIHIYICVLCFCVSWSLSFLWVGFCRSFGVSTFPIFQL